MPRAHPARQPELLLALCAAMLRRRRHGRSSPGQAAQPDPGPGAPHAGAPDGLAVNPHLDWRLLAIFTVPALVGAFAGNRIASRVDASRLTAAFAVLLARTVEVESRVSSGGVSRWGR